MVVEYSSGTMTTDSLLGLLLCTMLLSIVPIEDADKRRRGDTKDHPLAQWFTNFSEADELLKLAAARQQVSMIAFKSVLTHQLIFCPKNYLFSTT